LNVYKNRIERNNFVLAGIDGFQSPINESDLRG